MVDYASPHHCMQDPDNRHPMRLLGIISGLPDWFRHPPGLAACFAKSVEILATATTLSYSIG